MSYFSRNTSEHTVFQPTLQSFISGLVFCFVHITFVAAYTMKKSEHEKQRTHHESYLCASLLEGFKFPEKYLKS